MNKNDTGRLVILAGPSCVGKSPLVKALTTYHPEISESLQPLVLYNSRGARPGERDGIDYHFRTGHFIDGLRNREDFVVMQVRGDIQALDLEELKQQLFKGDVLFEGNPFIGNVLLTHPAIAGINKLSVFMSPLSRDEILAFQSEVKSISLSDEISGIMKKKLIRRTKRQKGNLTTSDLEDIEIRASSAYNELMDAYLYSHVIPNHDGEDSENWKASEYPKGDAGKALNNFVTLLKGKKCDNCESWEVELLA